MFLATSDLLSVLGSPQTCSLDSRLDHAHQEDGFPDKKITGSTWKWRYSQYRFFLYPAFFAGDEAAPPTKLAPRILFPTTQGQAGPAQRETRGKLRRIIKTGMPLARPPHPSAVGQGRTRFPAPSP